MDMNMIAILLSLVLALSLLYAAGVRSNRKRRLACKELEEEFSWMQLEMGRSEVQCDLEYNVELLRRAEKASKSVEAKVRARFPDPPYINNSSSRAAILAGISSYLGSESFRVGAGAAETMFYNAWDGIDPAPIVETIKLIGHDIAVELGSHGAQAFEDAGHAAEQILKGLVKYYHEHPKEFLTLIKDAAEVFAHFDEKHVTDLVLHLFDVNHLQIYGHALEPLAHTISDGIAHSSHIALDHVHHLDPHAVFHHGGGVPHAHFPFVTLMLSSFREIKLLDAGKTEVETSLKNVTLDLAGTGGGAFFGAKAGAAFGSLFPGIGTVIGAVVGSIAGAIVGREGTNSIKDANMKRREVEYDVALAAANTNLDAAARALHGQLSSVVAAAKAEYINLIGAAPGLRGQPELRIAWYATCVRDAIVGQISRFERQLNGQFGHAMVVAPGDRWFDPIVGGSVADPFRIRMKEILGQKVADVQVFKEEIPASDFCRAEPLTALTRLSQVSLAFDHDVTRKAIAANGFAIELRRSLIAGLVIWVQNASEALGRSLAPLSTKMAGHASAFAEVVKKENDKVANSKELLLVELRKLGKD